MDIGTEEGWDFSEEGEEPLDKVLADPPPASETPDAPVDDTDESAPPFHKAFKKLCLEHGLDDFFYVARRKDGMEEVGTWLVPVAVTHATFRDRAARLCFEVRGILRNMEGVTWPRW